MEYGMEEGISTLGGTIGLRSFLVSFCSFRRETSCYGFGAKAAAIGRRLQALVGVDSYAFDVAI